MMDGEVVHRNYFEALQDQGEDSSVELQLPSLDQPQVTPSEKALQHPIIWIDLEMTGMFWQNLA